jgi:MFS family permease
VIVLLVCAIDGADLAMLGAAFKIFEEELGMGPSTLGKVAMVQSIAMSVTMPVWGWMCDTGFASRRVLWTVGITGWALAMAALATASSLRMILLIRVANGVFLGSLMPLTQSWVAETVPLATSGRVFGFLGAAGVFGGIVTTMFITSMGGSTIAFGGGAISGWRLICLAISALSLCCAVAVWLVIGGEGGGKTVSERPSLYNSYREIACNLREHWKSFNFRIIIYQGVTGGIPWSALAFKIMFLRYVGFSSGQINIYTAAVVIPKVLGGMVGGFLGDYASQASPRHGRALVGQFAVGCGIPLMLVQIVVFPKLIGTVLWPYVLCDFLFCLVASWTPAGVIRPLFLGVVDPRSRASIVAWKEALEILFSNLLGAPFVGFLAEHFFQYQPTSLSVEAMSPELRQHNYAALQWSLAVMTTVPWILCFAAISGLHWSHLYDGTGVSKDKAALLDKRPRLSDSYGSAVA